MGTPENKQAEIEQRRARVAAMYCEGKTLRQIGQAEEVHFGTVWRDLEHIRQEWRASSIRDFDSHIAAELAKIDLVEYEATAAWERSQRNAVTRTQGKSVMGEVDVTKTTGQAGEPRFLAIILDCVGRRCKLLGLDEDRPPDDDKSDTGSQSDRSKVIAFLSRIADGAGGDGASNGAGHHGSNGHANGHAG